VIFLGEGDLAIESALSYLISRHSGYSYLPAEEVMNAVRHLLTCPWFYRVWIFQELALSNAPQIQYGQSRLPWNVLCDAASSITDKAVSTKFDQPDLLGSLASLLSLDERIKILEQMDAAKYRVAKRTVEKSHPRMIKNSGVSLSKNFSTEEVKQLETFNTFINILVSRRGFGVSDPRRY
jgi:hypothetical protein